MNDSVLASIAALSTLPIPALKERWRELFQTEPPAFNRGYLENRLTFRIQELAYGGIAPVTNTRLDAIATDEKYVDREAARKRIPERPVPSPCWRAVTNISAGPSSPYPPSPTRLPEADGRGRFSLD